MTRRRNKKTKEPKKGHKNGQTFMKKLIANVIANDFFGFWPNFCIFA